MRALIDPARGGERTSSHSSVRDVVYHIFRESRQHAHREHTGFLPSSAPGRRGGRVDIVISDAAARQFLVDIVVADPTRGDLVERAVKQDLVAATDAERRKETHYRDRAAGTKCVPFALDVVPYNVVYPSHVLYRYVEHFVIFVLCLCANAM